MRIACIGYLHGSGGAERQITMLANAMAKRGHEVFLLVLASFNKRYDISDKVNVCDLTYAENQAGNKIWLRYRALFKALKKIKPECSIHFWLQSAYLTAFMPEKQVGKIIYSERGDPGDTEYQGARGFVRKLSFHRVAGFVFQSEGARDYFPDKIRRRSVIIHNSVLLPCDKFEKPCADREPKIVTVGRLHPQKNQKLLIRAFSEIAEEFPKIRLEIYGEGEQKEALAEEIRKNGLTGRIKLMGSRKDIFDCIYPAQMFVLTSDYEGMPNALLEAMALGVPCISTDCKPGGARTLICHEKNGLIVPLGDEKELASAMRRLLRFRDFAGELSGNGIKIRETHEPNKIFDQWEEYVKGI
ncbi:MAG: glycosyltransferase family 4 protein [Lachnospiraceae bacterium]|jgi:glycosyltransferase involved in cell wall biosynthesis|nr:glycosyltransferase family 4 protein [Lachnospiraceae bacterium]